MLKRICVTSTPTAPTARVLWSRAGGAMVFSAAAVLLLSGVAAILPTTPACAQETNPAQPGAAGAQQAVFLSGPIRKSDVLSIVVAGEPNLSGPQRVDSNG